MRVRVGAVVVLIASAALASGVGCATTEKAVAFEEPQNADATAATFQAPDGSEAGPDAESKVGQCATTLCPAPYASCPVREDRGGFLGLGPPVPPVYACSTNLEKDDGNCGACGLKCPQGLEVLGIQTHCIEGTCQGLCLPNLRDCNAVAEDGCEVDIRTNPSHCGVCGHACKTGEICSAGACIDPNVCPPPQVRCGGACVDRQSNNQNCGACGYDCDVNAPDGGRPALPPHMSYGCAGGTCGHAGCDQGWADCNANLADGCEADLHAVTSCGSCGNVCAPGEPCSTPLGATKAQCISLNTCTDTQSDSANCGSCGFLCTSPVLTQATRANGFTSCHHGRCGYTCSKGFADCNGRDEDGCEADLAHDPRNCGGCGLGCPLAGQPCVDGACATTSCDAGATR